MNKLFWIIAVFCVVPLCVQAGERPLLAMNFNQAANDAPENAGRLSAKVEAVAESVALPKRVAGVTGRTGDSALAFPGGQVNNQEKYPKFSSVQVTPVTPPKELEAWTLSFWFKLEEKEKYELMVFCAGERVKGDSGAVSSGLFVSVNPDQKGKPQFRVGVNGQNFWSWTFAEDYTQTWQFATLVFDQGQLNFYVGTQEKEPSTLGRGHAFDATSVTLPSVPWQIGSANTGYTNTHNFRGALDNVLFYDRALSEEQIQDLYHLVVPREMLP